MDWSPAKSESSLPSPVRSRSRSGSPSPPPPKTITINLFPLTDSIEFAPKHLSFSPDQEIKVGRVSGSRNQKEAKADNGVFSCDVMSREHALLKEENGKILIKDLKSTHGTFVNNVRLGDGTVESDWRVLNHRDIITFGHSVRRNQNLYKHLSAYIFYPKETKGEIHSPNTSNGNTPVAISISNVQTVKTEQISQNASSSQEVTSLKDDETPKNLMLQSRNEGPASYYIAKSGGLPSTTPNATNPLSSKFDEFSVIKSHTTDNVTQASEALIDDSKQDSPSKTSEEMSTSIQKLKIDQSDEKLHIDAEIKELPTNSSFQENNDDDIPMENAENDEIVKDSNNDDNDENVHESVSPEIAPDTNPVVTEEEVVVIQTSTVSKTTASFVAPAPIKDRTSTRETREIKQPRTPRREKEVNSDKVENENLVVSNGEGPSHATEYEPSTTITSRKRKYEEIDDDEDGPEKVNDLREKLAELEERAKRATKRRKWDMVYSTVLGMAAGAVGIGACAYLFAGV
ncbi:hypothetical protein C1646_670152 [Rhizophagus diaphanus]|nr:hypothetical protein C1646_670152 [Rhizophagus diaphanus] [Rhizophagus sp. MUCL 43196]